MQKIASGSGSNPLVPEDQRERRSPFTKILLVMKLTALLLTIAFLQVHAAGSAQTVTISGKEHSVETSVQCHQAANRICRFLQQGYAGQYEACYTLGLQYAIAGVIAMGVQGTTGEFYHQRKQYHFIPRVQTSLKIEPNNHLFA